MSGLLFLLALVLCVWGCVWIAKYLGKLVTDPAWRSWVTVGVFLALLVSPFFDEVIGKYQFESLCKATGIESVDISRAKGKNVKLEIGVEHSLGGTAVPIRVESWIYKDVNSDEILFQHNNYRAAGGWLMRYTPFGMGSEHSMLFQGNGCSLALWQRMLQAANITVIN